MHQNRKGSWNRHENRQYFIGNEKWIFSKMLAKGMQQISQIEFENCNFFQLLQTPHFFSLQWPKIYNSSGKGIKTGKVEE